MKNILDEFKKFICRGNVMDMAVGIIIGGAFTAIVNSLVTDIINPILGIFGGLNFDQLEWKISEGVVLTYGKFITAVLNFLIMALVVFLLVRIINNISDKYGKKEEPKAPATKKCPYCKSEIEPTATRCPHCTSQLD